MVRTQKRLIRVVIVAVVIFVLGTLVLCLAGLRDDIGKTDVALVLGSKVEVSGKPSSRLQARLDETVKLYMVGWFPWIIASGGLGKEGYDEAVVMRDYLVAQGVPQDHILLDSKGSTTFDSAQNTLQILREKRLKSVFVVSQYFHIPRSRLALKRSGIKEIRSASPSYFELRDLYSAPRELLGFFSYLLRSFDKK